MSEIDICNRALTRVGAQEVTSSDGTVANIVEDGSVETRQVKLHYVNQRKSCIEWADWTFAAHRTKPAKDAQAPAWGFSSRFPSDEYIRVIWASEIPNEEVKSSLRWTVEGDFILADADVIYVKGVIDVTDVTKFSPMFEDMLVLELASLFALPLARSSKLHSSLMGELEDTRQKARAANGRQGPGKPTFAGDLAGARRLGNVGVGAYV